jgi:uncharacterized membrane protein YkoI
VIGAERKSVTRAVAALGVAVVLCALRPAGAAEAVSNTRPVEHQISREQALRILQDRYGSAARVVRTDEVDEGGRLVYIFRLLSDSGRVWIVHIDANSGAEVP